MATIEIPWTKIRSVIARAKTQAIDYADSISVPEVIRNCLTWSETSGLTIKDREGGNTAVNLTADHVNLTKGNATAQLTTEGLSLFKGTDLIALFGSLINLGSLENKHIAITNDSIQFLDGDSVITSLGFPFTLGPEDGTHITLSSTGIYLYDAEALLAHISSVVEQQGDFWTQQTTITSSDEETMDHAITLLSKRGEDVLSSVDASVVERNTASSYASLYAKNALQDTEHKYPLTADVSAEAHHSYSSAALRATCGDGFIGGIYNEARINLFADIEDSSIRLDANNILINNEALKDYVIAEGTNGAWTYRKWHSGTVEAWASFTTSKNNYTTVNGWYARYDDFTIPSGIFTDFSTQAAMPTVIANVNVGTGFTIASNINCISTNKIRVFSLENQSGTQTCNYKLYAIGK